MTLPLAVGFRDVSDNRIGQGVMSDFGICIFGLEPQLRQVRGRYPREMAFAFANFADSDALGFVRFGLVIAPILTSA